MKFDCIVIGAGAMGLAASAFLATSGCKVLAIDQYAPPHNNGSHGGQSRITRKAYFEHPDYVPLLKRSYENWRTLETEIGTQIYFETGIVYFGPPAHPTMLGVERSSRQYNIPITLPPSDDFRAFKIPSHFKTLFEPEAGFLLPDRAIHSYHQVAIQHGAEIHSNECVKSWTRKGSDIVVTTDRHEYVCGKLIVTAGSWTSELVPALQSKLKVTRQVLVWIKPKSPELFQLGNFPCWFIEDPEKGMYYGFPMLTKDFDGPVGLKIASHRPGAMVHPDDVDRVVTKKDVSDVMDILDTYIPGAGTRVVATKTCLYTYSEDENFIIDFLPDHDEKVIIACGFSGHGFKFVSVIGEILSDLATKGKTELPIGFLSLKRFAS